MGVELFLKEQYGIFISASNGVQIPYGNYGTLMKILLYKVTNDSVWLDSLPDYQHNIGNISVLQQLLCSFDIDFANAQSYLDESRKIYHSSGHKRRGIRGH